MSHLKKFEIERAKRISEYQTDTRLTELSQSWLESSMRSMYVYNFDWLGRPIIQYPNDIVAMQEIIWKVRPDLIIETGIAHGGSLIFSASMLAMLDMEDAIKDSEFMDPSASKRKVLGIDIDIREHNRIAIEEHPMSSRIQMIQGSSIDPDVVNQVKDIAKAYTRVLVCLDSNHTHDHVLAELEAYAKLTSIDSYCIVFDTFVEDMPDDMFPDRPWGKGNNPKTAVREYLQRLYSRNKEGNDDEVVEFKVMNEIDSKLLITVAPSGYLKRKR